MKAIYLHAAGAIALTFSIAACVPSAKMPIIVDTPEPVARPAPTATPSPSVNSAPAVQEATYANYLDAPQTSGTWEYASFPFGSQALFNGRTPETSFAVNCLSSENRITLQRPIAPSGPRVMRITTETVSRSLSAQPAPENLAGITVSIDPRDPLLDAMAITKGRFAVALDGERTLYLPAWVEVSRVIEDCR